MTLQSDLPSWTFANPLSVTPKVYKVLKITFSLKITLSPLLISPVRKSNHASVQHSSAIYSDSK